MYIYIGNAFNMVITSTILVIISCLYTTYKSIICQYAILHVSVLGMSATWSVQIHYMPVCHLQVHYLPVLGMFPTWSLQIHYLPVS